MPLWKLKLVLAAFMVMLIGETCRAQAVPAAADAPATPASAATRGGTPTPYSPPVAVPSAAGQIRPLQLPSPAISVTPPPAPRFPSTCDSTGCWGADGTRYNAVGGALVRPDGTMCQNIGGVIQCP